MLHGIGLPLLNWSGAIFIPFAAARWIVMGPHFDPPQVDWQDPRYIHGPCPWLLTTDTYPGLSHATPFFPGVK